MPMRQRYRRPLRNAGLGVIPDEVAHRKLALLNHLQRFFEDRLPDVRHLAGQRRVDKPAGRLRRTGFLDLEAEVAHPTDQDVRPTAAVDNARRTVGDFNVRQGAHGRVVVPGSKDGSGGDPFGRHIQALRLRRRGRSALSVDREPPQHRTRLQG